MAHAHSFAANPHWLPLREGQAIGAVPGKDGWPLVGTLVEQLRDPPAFTRRMHARFGPIYRTRTMGRRWVTLLGPDANELVLFDRARIFSSEQGWGPILNLLFPRGLMLLDGEAHRADRKALSVAFKPEPMRRYAEAIEAGMAARIAAWSGRDILFYPEIKQLTLDLAASSFLGLPLGPEAERINRAFVDMVAASIGIARVPLPFSAMRRGVKARAYLVDLFTAEVPRRRAGAGEDLFSRICRAEDEAGRPLDTAAIVDHIIFLMMAAHDTITSSLSSLVFELGCNPEWQERLAAEDDDAGSLADMAFREALRLQAPVPSLPRRALRPFRFGGYDFPAGTFVTVQPSFTHHMAEHWPEPERFDPLRFTPDRVRARHKYAWVPFGGGAHMCLGLHFATMQARIFVRQLLAGYRIRLLDPRTRWQAWPIPKPIGGLKVRIVPA
jgi:cytochrome P450